MMKIDVQKVLQSDFLSFLSLSSFYFFLFLFFFIFSFFDNKIIVVWVSLVAYFPS